MQTAVNGDRSLVRNSQRIKETLLFLKTFDVILFLSLLFVLNLAIVTS